MTRIQQMIFPNYFRKQPLKISLKAIMIQELLTEKLRPKELKHMILPSRISKLFESGLNHNVLLSGSPGCGKTTLAKILAAPFPHIFINVSDESSVETIRVKINDFCSTISVLDGKSSKKIVVLDEFDGASDQFYKALRGTIEKFAGNARFIATCNYINKVPDAIQSRFEVIDFNPVSSDEEDSLKTEWNKRVNLILTKLNIQINEEALNEFQKAYYPDFRSALNKVQTWMIEGVQMVDSNKIKELGWSYESLYNLIVSSKDPVKNYQEIVGEYQGKVDEVMSAMGDEFIKWIIKNKPELKKIIPGAIVLVAEHQSQRTQVIDPMVSLLSLVFQIQKMIE
jgi:replication factor C small subunit